MKNIFTKTHIFFNTEAKTQDDAFKAIAKIAFDAGYVENEEAYYLGLHEREKEATTGFQDGIAIPHSKNNTVLKPGVFLVKFTNPIAWNALDGQDVHVAIALTIPETGGEMHLRILSKIARKLIDDNFRTVLKTSDDIETLYQVITSIEI